MDAIRGRRTVCAEFLVPEIGTGWGTVVSAYYDNSLGQGYFAPLHYELEDVAHECTVIYCNKTNLTNFHTSYLSQ